MPTLTRCVSVSGCRKFREFAGIFGRNSIFVVGVSVPPGDRGRHYLCVMKSSQDLQTASVKVLPCLREFILCVNGGSDIIIPGRESKLWGIVKMHLDLVPPDYKPVPASGSDNCIRIAIFRSHRMCYNRNSHKYDPGKKRPNPNIVVDTIWRNYLNPVGQEAVASHLMHTFKLAYRSYMTGALGNNPELRIHDAIYSFCELYHITMENITYEMLRKDWFRFRKKHGSASPIPTESIDF